MDSCVTVFSVPPQCKGVCKGRRQAVLSQFFFVGRGERRALLCFSLSRERERQTRTSRTSRHILSSYNCRVRAVQHASGRFVRVGRVLCSVDFFLLLLAVCVELLHHRTHYIRVQFSPLEHVLGGWELTQRTFFHSRFSDFKMDK